MNKSLFFFSVNRHQKQYFDSLLNTIKHNDNGISFHKRQLKSIVPSFIFDKYDLDLAYSASDIRIKYFKNKTGRTASRLRAILYFISSMFFLLKVKKFLDDEFKVIDIETGPYRIIDRGREIEFETLTNVLINYNRNIVSVGSGFTVDERRYYYERPDEIIGATITVQYFGISKNKEGKESLRFPTIKTIHGQERTV